MRPFNSIDSNVSWHMIIVSNYQIEKKTFNTLRVESFDEAIISVIYLLLFDGV